MSEKELNELRLHANEIIRLLYEAKAVEQLHILHQWALLSLKELDPEGLKEQLHRITEIDKL